MLCGNEPGMPDCSPIGTVFVSRPREVGERANDSPPSDLLRADWLPTGTLPHQAVAQAQKYIAGGYNVVGNLDLEKFFTRHTSRAPGGSTRLSLVSNMKSRETKRVEVVVPQGLLDRQESGHALSIGLSRIYLSSQRSSKRQPL